MEGFETFVFMISKIHFVKLKNAEHSFFDSKNKER